MREMELWGTVERALSHFALVGLASIISEASPGVRLWWRDGDEPRPMISSGLTETEIGEVVQAHAVRLSAPDSWLRATVDLDRTQASRRSVFAPRAKAPVGPEQWRTYFAERVRTSAAIERTLDVRFIEGLGEPAWWRVSDREARPDDGASRWEMKTRNRGEEMVTHRLLPLATACAARSPEELTAGLRGIALEDGTGRGEASRSGTGLAPPGEVDSAVAWCALWAMAQVPPTAVRDGVSVTPGLSPWGRTHPTHGTLPIFTSPATPARWGQIMRSGSLSAIASRGVGENDFDARTWLKEQGVVGVLRCKIHKGGSQSAPERWVLPGELDLW